MLYYSVHSAFNDAGHGSFYFWARFHNFTRRLQSFVDQNIEFQKPSHKHCYFALILRGPKIVSLFSLCCLLEFRKSQARQLDPHKEEWTLCACAYGNWHLQIDPALAHCKETRGRSCVDGNHEQWNFNLRDNKCLTMHWLCCLTDWNLIFTSRSHFYCSCKTDVINGESFLLGRSHEQCTALL